MRSHGYSAGNWSTHNAYHSDANGNVTALMNSTGVSQALDKYNPYGGLISSSGTLAGANTMRFSSKPAILSATGAWGFYYYGYRFYDPGMQRWLNRDPLGEGGGMNLFRFVSNSPMMEWDALGLLGGGRRNAPNPPGQQSPRLGGPGRGLDGCLTPKDACQRQGGRWESPAARNHGGSISDCVASRLGTLPGIVASVIASSAGAGAAGSAAASGIVITGGSIGSAVVVGGLAGAVGGGAGLAVVIAVVAIDCANERCYKN
jgi:RHS repeat-associated protein